MFESYQRQPTRASSTIPFYLRKTSGAYQEDHSLAATTTTARRRPRSSRRQRPRGVHQHRQEERLHLMMTNRIVPDKLMRAVVERILPSLCSLTIANDIKLAKEDFSTQEDQLTREYLQKKTYIASKDLLGDNPLAYRRKVPRENMVWAKASGLKFRVQGLVPSICITSQIRDVLDQWGDG